MAQAISRENAKFGGLGALRYYASGLPPAWTTLNGLSTRPLVVSFKASPTTILSGADDSYLSAWFASAPTDRTTWWTYFHEPENDIAAGEFTAADFRAAFRHIALLADGAHNTDLRATLILMGVTAVPSSGRTFADYYPGSDVVDVLGWDVYNHAAANGVGYSDPTSVYGKVVTLSQQVGKPFGIGETGAPLVPGDAGSARAGFLSAAATYLRAAGAQFVIYYDSTRGGNYALTDTPSVAAWSAQVDRT
jgi:hypothetical protein